MLADDHRFGFCFFDGCCGLRKSHRDLSIPPKPIVHNSSDGQSGLTTSMQENVRLSPSLRVLKILYIVVFIL